MGLLDVKKTEVVEEVIATAPVKDYARVDRLEGGVLWAVVDGFTVIAQKPAFAVSHGDKIAKKDLVIL